MRRFRAFAHSPVLSQAPADAPAAPAVAYDEEAIAAAVRAALAVQPPAAPAAPESRTAPDLNPDAGRVAGDGADAVDVSRSVANEDGVVTDPTRRRELGRLMHRFYRGQTQRDPALTTSAVVDMARGGYYGEEARARFTSDGERAMNTLSDANGGVFLPTVVLNEVLRLVPEYGVIRRLARIIDVPSGTIKIPNLAGGIPAFWVGEGATIKSRAATFSSITLDPVKMGVIVPWTNELEEEAGASFMDLIVTLVAEGFANLEDTTAFYGDGTSAYGGITGLATFSGVNVYTMGTGKTNFNQLTYDDLIGVLQATPVQVRRRGTWVFHPDTELTLAKLKDNDGRPIFIDDYRTGATGATLLGRPVEWAQATYAQADTGVSKVLGFYGDFDTYLIAQGRGMTSMLLDQATIQDVDDSTVINLGAQDMKALRTTQRLFMRPGIPSAITRIRTAAV